MCRRFGMLFLLALLCAPASFARTGAYSSYSAGTSRAYAGSRSGHARAYSSRTRTYSFHSRSRSETPRRSHRELRTGRTRYGGGYSGSGSSSLGAARDSHGRIHRSSAAKGAFKRQSPCPSTGRGSGPCPGYVIDHVRPLECGGADNPLNMHWQTIAEGKAKDKTERYCR